MEKENKIGAVWIKTSKAGNKFMSGVINDQKVVIFKNNYKEQENHPDYIVYKQDDNYKK